MSGAGFCALAAVDAFIVIDDRKVVLHCNGAFGAGANAFSAGNTTEFAGIQDSFSAIVGGAGDIDFCISRNAHEELLGTAQNTGTAGDASVGIDIRAVFGKADCILRAYAGAVSACKASVFADFMSARKLIFLCAVNCAAILKSIFGVIAARAATNAHGGLGGGEGDSEDICDDRLFACLRYMAIGKLCLAFGKFFSESRTARATASAAVCARKMRKNGLHFFICICFAELCNKQNADSKNKSDRGENAEDDTDLRPINGR